MNKSNTTIPSNLNLGCSPDALAQRQAELLALIRQTVPEVTRNLRKAHLEQRAKSE